MANDTGGVWRTIGGRKIFIKDGQDVSTAMKESGKFKSKSNKGLSEEERKKKIAELEKKRDETQGFLQKGAIQEEINMLKDNFEGTKEEYREHLAKEPEKREAEYRKEKEERMKLRDEQNKGQDDYRMAHRPSETGITADNLLQEGDEGIGAPKDIYEHPEYYSIGEKKYLTETMQQLNDARNNPEAEITIYRATTGDTINDGDWITLSKNYADMHNESQLDGKGKVLEMKVKAKDIQFAGDALEEWGYFPKKSSKGNPYMKAYNEYMKEHPNSKLTYTNFKKNME